MTFVKQASSVSVELQKIPSWAKTPVLILGASIIIGLFAHISIPLPFTPIPIATQPFIVMFLAILIGSKRATAAVATFLVQGAVGLPVFACGASGIATLMGPRAGYLIGYLVAAYVVGRLIEVGGKRTILNAFLALFAGNVCIFVCGALVLSFFVGGVQAILLGVVPFVLGDLVKIAVGLKFLQLIGWEEK